VNDENVEPLGTKEHDENNETRTGHYVQLQNCYLLGENKENEVICINYNAILS
jgi:hypothetical protein